ncbi:MAG: hypothetical protein KDK56_00220 [Simkania sp.]|nr:hypothetical protein [Simkania sp.]MCP5490474.1 anion transporter [Chlamydiales bacterium]
MSLPLVVLILVFLGIALRQLFRIPIRIWHIMGLGACLVLLTGRISFISAWHSIDWGIIGFLFGMFVVGQALEESGYLSEIVAKFMLHGGTTPRLVALIVFGLGLLSAVLMNDTLAIMGTPILLCVAHRRGLPSHPLLLGLAFAITIGSVMSPIGNPQNLLIALSASIKNPFVTFLAYLAVPTLLSLIVLYFWILKTIKPVSGFDDPPHASEPYNRRLMLFCRIALLTIISLIGLNIVFSLLGVDFSIPLPAIALIPALFLLIFAPKRREVLLRLDWHTLIFFIAMFILMQSVWETSSIQAVLSHISFLSDSTGGILSVGILASQLISNVPLVALYLPTLESLSQSNGFYMALAAGSTLAGNLLIFGAASNLIIIQNAEKRGEKGIDFFEFAKHGIPLTFITFLIYWGYLALLT